MKKHIYLLLSLFCLVSCGNFQDLNTNPNSPQQIPMYMVFSGAQKLTMDNITDYYNINRDYTITPQYFSQRLYTYESLYTISEKMNKTLFDNFYLAFNNMNEIVRKSDEPNMRAAARIFRAWIMMTITDTWGDVPYSQAGLLMDSIFSTRYDRQKDIYMALMDELRDAQDSIDESRAACPAGADQIYAGNSGRWKRFANTLRCRLALHLSKVDPEWKTYIAEAVTDGVFTSVDDDAVYHYSTRGTDFCKFYKSTLVQGRNDYTISRVLSDIMQGKEDTLNHKSHPWKGVFDQRLLIFTTPADNGAYDGVPYGLEKAVSGKTLAHTPDWSTNPPYVLDKEYQLPLLGYAELMFILCEANDYDVNYYQAGIGASFRHWAIASMTSIPAEDVLDYIGQVTGDIFTSGDKNRMAEALAIQKYIDLFTNPTEAWTELRRTGYPEQLLRPGEISTELNGEKFPFTPTVETRGFIRRRMPYPSSESTLNGEGYREAVSRLVDGTNNQYSPLFFDIRTSPYHHPENL